MRKSLLSCTFILSSQHLTLEVCHSPLIPKHKPHQPFPTASCLKIPSLPFFLLDCINEWSGVQQKSVTRSFFVTVTKATTVHVAPDGRGQERMTQKVILENPFFQSCVACPAKLRSNAFNVERKDQKTLICPCLAADCEGFNVSLLVLYL